MTDQLMLLVNTSRNFRFLVEPALLRVEHALLLALDAAAAEAYTHSDPDSARGKARRFGETLAKLLLRRAGRDSGTKKFVPQADRIEQLARHGLVPQEIKDLFHEVRKLGNEGIHEYSGDRDKAIAAVKGCFELGAWWYETETGSKVPHAFIPPTAAAPASLLDLLKGIESQVTKLQAAFEAGHPAAQHAEVRIRIGPAAPDRSDWHGGSEVACGDARYLVHDPVERIPAADRSWTLLQAHAHALDSHATPVWLRGLLIESHSAPVQQMIDGLTAQARFLNARQGRDGRLHILISARPAGATWSETFGEGQLPLDPLIVPLAMDVLLAIARDLVRLHATGQAHRCLSGDSILVAATGRRGALRDIGWAWLPRLPGEGGPYQAPEQQSLARGRAGPATDVFQLAALLQHTCAGFKPGAGQAIPMRAFLPRFPEQLDKLLDQALDPNPDRRPAMATFAGALKTGRQQLLMEA